MSNEQQRHRDKPAINRVSVYESCLRTYSYYAAATHCGCLRRILESSCMTRTPVPSSASSARFWAVSASASNIAWQEALAATSGAAACRFKLSEHHDAIVMLAVEYTRGLLPLAVACYPPGDGTVTPQR